ncbi:ParB-like nuclease domain protein [Anatilimnocola aggregata]|uniref:ParB-like nuclease domain protein n=1 Tax=Anatilimnocola aggregata TaxID=2528021 RepID=A0A517YF82_9BACT|nr:ParB N-terminal domain-containing protein [Anatilimnocola aggregata]QDU28895.1 ParB-like nuclease domain protein [Anatilimnocola aggregata]
MSAPPKSRLVGILRPLDELHPAPENDLLYKPVDPNDADVRALAASIRLHGVKEPLVVSKDGFLLSGHRRHVAAKLAGLTHVPCRVEPISREHDRDQFVILLREYNRQRNKSFAEKLREELVGIDAKTAHQSLITQRAERAAVRLDAMHLVTGAGRAQISAAKMPFLNAVLKILRERREYWPLSDRQIHYALLNAPPLRHASKPKSRYTNTKQAYGDLTDLLTRSRIEGRIPFHAIGDETRPVLVWNGYQEPSSFLRQEMRSLLHGYYRNLLQSQPNHIEVVAEKNTISPLCRKVCERYCVPLTTGRGYCSLPPRHAMAERYRRSGKDKLILLMVSDFDPDGEEIAHSFARSMRDDFGIGSVHAIKVALNSDQVRQFNLPPIMEAKGDSTKRNKFVAMHGKHVWEVEALMPDQLIAILDEAVRSVLDMEAWNQEVDAEAEDARQIEGVRRSILTLLRESPLEGFELEDDDE